MGARGDLGAVQDLGGGLPDDVLGERALARAARAGDHVDHAQGDRHVDVLEVVLPGASDDEGGVVLAHEPTVARDGNGGLAAEVSAGERVLARLDLRRRSHGSHLAAERARARAEIDQVVGRGDDLAVVFDQDQGVAQVAQVLQRRQQAGVVSGMEADRRLVEHVQDAGQAAADLAGQPDSLALASREGGRPPAEREVVEPDIDQELEPVADLAHQVAGDRSIVALKIQVAEEWIGPTQRPSGDLVEREAAEPDRGRVVAQPRSHARRARDVVHQSLELVAIPERDPRGLLDRREQPFVLEREGWLSLPRGHLDPGVAGAVQNSATGPAVEVVEGCIEVD